MSSSAAVFSVTTSSAVQPRTTRQHLITSRLSLPSPSSSQFIRQQRPIPRSINHGRNRNSSNTTTTFKPRRSTVLMEWQDCTVKMEIDVPISVAYNCYLDREAIPRWMPFISTVKVLEDKPELSRWSLKYKAFGRDLEFSWLARNMQPIPNQKIHWRSLEGLPNRGAVRFFPKGSSSCLVELTVSYEVPQLLSPVASALQPFLQNLLGRGLARFANFAKTYQTDAA
ncbi:putative coenzyme Q-binding protein COQ10, START [Helianthus annuus]|nr:putative coenzyme Q-binding protein COQ10, START [Helianthus annuus]KAJ0758349.1 putative coenzyme Q-binding protein COQ10, START [Helianthus annuus]KAJ0762008.1 putative coenzyme Q-binding protein COQ10, START [Helianthus annuus]